MRAFCVLLLLAACADGSPGPDGDQKSMEIALEADALPGAEPVESTEPTDRTEAALPPDSVSEQVIETLDCPRGGTVRVTVRRESSDEPYRRKGYLYWDYDACGTREYGTIDGTASYTREIEQGYLWRRLSQYFANLEYTGGAEGDCDAYVKLEQKWHTSDHRLELPGTCPHPVREWWGALGI